MIKTFFQYLWKKTTSLKDDQEGFVLMLTLSIFLFLFLLSMSIYAVGDTIHKKIQIQNACDAAAYSAAVVQADGLSRMATVNRAMSWTYVQMTNHQMDYITYRWLRLTAKRFQEDYDNAKAFHTGVVIGYQSGGWATLISWGIDLVASLFVDWKCDGKHTETDESEGKGWWCGMTPDDGHKKLKLNGADEPIEFDALKSLVLEFGSTFDLNQQAQPIISNADTWGGELAKQIEQDRNTLDAMNLALEMINTNTIKAMQETAEFVLKSMLRDSGDDYKDYSVYISIPQGQSPYTLAAAGGNVQRAYFQPLYNTEAYERLFLHMSTQEGVEYPLHKMFPISGDDGDDYDLQGFGLDQWFIRGTGTVANGTTRNEGALGLQRVYKDANLNETGVGVAFPGGKPIARGNHIADVAGVLQQYIPNKNSNRLMELLAKPLSSIFTAICDTFCDIHPSVGNRVNEEQHLGMCFNSSDTAALYADYNWASGKWVCIAKGNLTARTACPDCGYGDDVFCGPGRESHDMGGIVPVRHRGYGHFHIPKWFCGAVELDWEELIMGIVNFSFPIPEEGRHGYSESLFDAKSLTIPFYQLFGKTYNGIITKQNGNLMVPREKYESCVTFADGLLGLKINKDAKAGMFHGHARIYGDDKEIWNEHYIGPAVKPWVLNKNYFAGQGTIVVGVARKHTNPLAQIFTYLEEGNRVSQTTVLSAFDPPPGNYMWAMSAARAGYRHTRRDGLYDQYRMYQVVYDPTSDAESLSYESNLEEGKPYYYHETSGNHDTPWKHERPDDETQPLVLAGCVCSGNEERFRYVWNLCETDWDATLLPLRYAGTGAALLVDSGKEKDFFQYDHDTSQDINSWRRDCLDAIKRQGNFEDYVGDGRNWIWYPMPAGGTIGDNVNAMNPGVYLDKVWKPLGSGGNKPNLETLLPGSPGVRLDLERIMKMNRIL